ncbi:TRAP-T-associated universal stress protein TeaD [Candidatus Entotheonellaceae bacterium PAL068K]
MYRTILVPLDGSEVDTSILAQMVELARGYEAHLLLLTVGLPLPPGLVQAHNAHCLRTFQAEAALERIRTYLQTQGIEVSTMVYFGEPAVEILAVAEQQQVDLIVLNSRGGGGTPSPFLGSVTEKVAGASAVPVLVLHARAKDREPG